MSYCEPDEVAEIDRERHFHQRQSRFQRAISTAPPRLRSSFDPVLRRSCEIRFVIEERFQHRTHVVKRETDSERKQARKEQHLYNPSTRIKLAMRRKVKDR